MTVGMSVADAGEFRVIDDYTNDGSNAEKDTPVSYTHLTLPTIYSV